MLVTIILKQNKNGKWFWRMVASNGRILAHSEEYSSRKKALQTATRMQIVTIRKIEER